MRYILTVLLLLFASKGWALTYINSGTTFPYELNVAGETYEFTEDVTCDTACLFVTASNITIDGGGYTMTFGDANNPGLTNTDFELWSDVNTPTNWTIVSGTATRVSSQWPEQTYDAELSATAVVRSPAVSLTGGQSYEFYSIIEGSSSDSYTITLHRASDDVIVGTRTITGSLLDRGFAMNDGQIGSTEQEYRPTSNEDVYFKITCAGTSVKRLVFADIKPRNHYGIARYTYKNTSYFPDYDAALFGGTGLGLTIQDLNITQGNGEGVKSLGIMMSGVTGSVTNVNITMNGHNTGAVKFFASGALTLDDVDTDTSNNAHFNRMHAPSGIEVITSSSAAGDVIVKNCDVYNDPEMGIVGGALNTPVEGVYQAKLYIHDNYVRNREFNTEAYAITVHNVLHAEIYNNTIQPYRGRGIFSDTAGTWISKNVTIRNNNIIDIWETGNLEYDRTGLEATGIRIRNWGEAPLSGFKVYENTIVSYSSTDGGWLAYGIAVNSWYEEDGLEIYDNHITTYATGTGNWAVGIALHLIDYSALNQDPLIIRNNTIVGDAQSYGIGIGGIDGGPPIYNVHIYSNDITVGEDAIRVWNSDQDVDGLYLYCNDIETTGADNYPLYFQGSIVDMYVSNNLLTSGHAAGYKAYAATDYSSGVITCGNGTISLDGGGTLGTEGSCSYGSPNCYSTAGAGGEPIPPPDPPDPPDPIKLFFDQSGTLNFNQPEGTVNFNQ